MSSDENELIATGSSQTIVSQTTTVSQVIFPHTRPMAQVLAEASLATNFMLNYKPNGNENKIYECCKGTFAFYENVVLKRASKTKITGGLTHSAIAMNDLEFMQRLARKDNFARIYYHIDRLEYTLLVVEGYDFNLTKHIRMQGRNDAKSHQMNPDVNDGSVIFSQLLRAVGYLHERGIVHRDIQTKNVFLIEGKFHI